VSPNASAATAAKATERPLAPPPSSGPLAAMTPAPARAMPTQAQPLGWSPVRTPKMTGTAAPVAAIGATTPLVPLASAA
jgi:hypothetical protein